METDLYTVTQALGKYQNDESYTGTVPPLHPLLYVSKSAYKGSMDRYSREECIFHISKNEFYNFINNLSPQNFAIFITDNTTSDSIRFQTFLVMQQRSSKYLVKKEELITYYKKDLSIRLMTKTLDSNKVTIPSRNYYWQDVTGTALSKRDMISAVFKRKNFLFVEDKFDNQGFEITCDVVTIYDIFTNRGACVDAIKNYAKKMTLEIFENDVTRLNEPSLIPSLNLYLKTNAFLLGIDESHYPSLLPDFYYFVEEMSEMVLQDYIDNTLKDRLYLIDMIRQNILLMD
jgi:hypothetical protein